ncbi:hypothetical protein [Actibacterium ureilyticum]|uniref:hypothetical protein n=1 Tax=Actibacterium ureilyticum TaxID=1590614 RepID=UPI000BAAC545|nr:hypothetical protein [Actibacterium ureilyticum]
MTKHIIDRTRDRKASTKVEQYVRIEAEDLPHPQTKTLQQRPHHAETQTRMKRFLDIERRKDG